MSITYTWKILDKTVIEQNPRLKNVVKTITWECKGVDSNTGKESVVVDTTTLRPALPKDFVELAETPDELMLQWVFETANNKKRIEDKILEDLYR